MPYALNGKSKFVMVVLTNHYKVVQYTPCSYFNIHHPTSMPSFDAYSLTASARYNARDVCCVVHALALSSCILISCALIPSYTGSHNNRHNIGGGNGNSRQKKIRSPAIPCSTRVPRSWAHRKQHNLSYTHANRSRARKRHTSNTTWRAHTHITRRERKTRKPTKNDIVLD